MNLARVADPSVDDALRKTFGQSKLRPLVDLLNDNSCTADKIKHALLDLANKADATYVTKANKYKKAMYYLERTFPIHPNNRVSVKPKQTEAVSFLKTDTKPHAPDGSLSWKDTVRRNAQGDVVEPRQEIWAPYCQSNSVTPVNTKCVQLRMTVEEYLMQNQQSTILLMIHMQEAQESRNMLWDGRSAEYHIISVIEVGKSLGIPLCVLKFPKPARTVYEGLTDVVKDYPNVTSVDIEKKHSCVDDWRFRKLLKPGIRTVVVIGFDRDVCVHANVFGGEQMNEEWVPRGIGHPKPSTPPTLVSALVNLADVVTSRPLVLTKSSGIIYPHSVQWGPLST
jgi:hypothetical protein